MTKLLLAALTAIALTVSPALASVSTEKIGDWSLISGTGKTEGYCALSGPFEDKTNTFNLIYMLKDAEQSASILVTNKALSLDIKSTNTTLTITGYTEKGEVGASGTVPVKVLTPVTVEYDKIDPGVVLTLEKATKTDFKVNDSKPQSLDSTVFNKDVGNKLEDCLTRLDILKKKVSLKIPDFPPPYPV